MNLAEQRTKQTGRADGVIGAGAGPRTADLARTIIIFSYNLIRPLASHTDGQKINFQQGRMVITI